MAFAALDDRQRAWELLSLVNPVHHGNSADAVATYKVEPYVVAADVYAIAPHTGRGCWTWYTGSAGWFYRLVIESLLGLTRRGAVLQVAPCLPPDWTTCTLSYRFGETQYRIVVTQGHGVGSSPGRMVTLDGIEQADGCIPLVDDHREHAVSVDIRQSASAPLPGLQRGDEVG